MRGQIIWYDLMTIDPDAALAFYAPFTGWTSEPMGQTPDGAPYTVLKAAGQQIGGVIRLPEAAAEAGAPPHWIAYIHVDDVDAAAARVEALGGRIHRPGTDIPTVGRFAVAADPQGGTFILFAPRAPIAPVTESIGAFSWAELNTTNHDDAWAFYSSLFGWQRRGEMQMPPIGPYLMFEDPSAATKGGMWSFAAKMNAPVHWLYYVTVSDADEAVASIQASGGRVLNGPVDIEGGRIAQCMDPQGAAFAVYADAATA